MTQHRGEEGKIENGRPGRTEGSKCHQNEFCIPGSVSEPEVPQSPVPNEPGGLVRDWGSGLNFKISKQGIEFSIRGVKGDPIPATPTVSRWPFSIRLLPSPLP